MNINLAGVRNIYNSTIDMLISSSGFGSPCTFVYEKDRGSQCPNCNYDPITGRSNGVYKTSPSGEIPFGYGQMCPVCNGVGKVSTIKKETVYLANVIGQKNFISVGDVGVTNGDMQSISKTETLSKIKSVDYIMQSGGGISEYTQNKFTRASEPQLVSLGDNRYIITNWKQSS